MHTSPTMTEQRARRLLHERIRPAIHAVRQPLTLTGWDAPDEPVPFTEAVGQDYRPLAVGTAWGAPWRTLWIHATGTVPAAWLARPDHEVELVVDLGFTGIQPGFQAEGLLHRADGSIVKAISPRNQCASWVGEADDVDIYIEAAANPDVAQGFSFAPTPYGDKATAGTDPLYRIRRVDLALRDVTVWELDQDLTVLLELAEQLDLDSSRRAHIDAALDRAVDHIDPADVPGTSAAARAELAGVLSSPATASAHHVMAVGHAHIDSAWLWPTRETARKCVRTFSSVLALMDEDPDFVFACSSAQQYQWVKEARPDLFERIRTRVAEGRFVPVGGMWLESDTNMPGGEAMARQMIEGKLFFLNEFGVETNDVWLPDSFGYSGALPQLMRAAGSRWFLSQKLSWNDTDKMPHHTFTWEGIDGSRVLTHFPPVDMYNSRLSVAELRHAESNFADKRVASSSIVPFGYGDGGGGPTREMLAAAHRFASMEGVPTVELGSPNDFFERAEAELADSATSGGPSVWRGEMYLEFHRGTYTSQLSTKQGNRRSEHLLREAELWAATATVREDIAYPYDVLTESWRTVLRNQFHDILPGTSIAWVYQQTEAEYAQVARDLEQVMDTATAALVGDGDTPLLLNAGPLPRAGVTALGAAQPRSVEGSVEVERGVDGIVISNDLLRLELDDAGLIRSWHDLVHDREVVAEGTRAALLQLHRDTPRQWDAWDVDAEYRHTVQDITGIEKLDVERDGADVVVRLRRPLGDASSVEEELRVRPGDPAVQLSFDIDWHERQKLLKLALPLDVMADTSAAETQFGYVRRPTHQNTSWDAARYEICAHRWLHVGEEGYGVAVSNDSTYGHDVIRDLDASGHPITTVRLSLLRAPLFPDPQADQGHHHLTIGVRAGATVADAVEDGYRLNLPPRVVEGDHEVEPLVTVDGPGVLVEAIKLAEDRSGDVIVRLYEALGSRANAHLVPGFEVSSITPTDLLERQITSDAVQVEAGAANLTLRPFQIVTLRLARAV